MENIHHIFFDLDDTLWDFEKNSTYVLEKLFVEFNLQHKLKTDFQNFSLTYKTINSDLWRQYSKKEIDKVYLRNHRFNLVFNKFEYDNHTENLEISEYYLRFAPQGKHLKEGCIEVLNYLKQSYQLHIITNGFKEVQFIKIDGCGLRNFFSTVIISEEHNLSKPDCEIYRLAEQLANTKNENCVMIGDNFNNDVEGALNAGWQAIYFSKNNHPNYNGKYIASLKELHTIF